MALDREYFDAIHIDVVKKKYYNANKVEAVFSDIRRQAEQLSAENEQMRAQLAALNGTKVEIGGAVMAAQALYKEIVDKAKAQAAEIRAGAERERAQLLDETRRQQEYAVQRVEKCYDSMKQQHMASIDALNAEWQDFLCGLFPDGKTPDEPEEPDEAETTESAGEPETPESAIDQGALEEKIGAIARELFSIDGEDAET